MNSTWLWIQSEKINGWYVMSGKSRHNGNWRAWAKKTPLQFRDPLEESGSIYMNWSRDSLGCCDSRAEALRELTESDLKTTCH